MADAAMNVTKSLKELSIQLALSQEDGSILSAAAQRAGVTGSGVVLGGGLTEAAQQMSDEIGEAPAAQQLGSLQEKQVELLRELVANAEAMKRAQAAAQAALEQWRRNMIRNPGGTAVRTGQAAVRAAVNAAFGERTQSPESE
jgi:ribosomal protein L18